MFTYAQINGDFIELLFSTLLLVANKDILQFNLEYANN